MWVKETLRTKNLVSTLRHLCRVKGLALEQNRGAARDSARTAERGPLMACRVLATLHSQRSGGNGLVKAPSHVLVRMELP